jgi:hypothetical protein
MADWERVPTAPEGSILVPALKTPAGIKLGKVGDFHDDLGGPGEKPPEDQRGFVDARGNFLDRQQASKAARAAGLDVPDSLDSQDLAPAIAKDKANPWERAPSQYASFMKDQGGPRRTTLQGVGQGAADPFIAAAQLEAHVLPQPALDAINWARRMLGTKGEISPASIDRAVKDREAGIQASRPIEYAPPTYQERAQEERGSHPVRTPMAPGVDVPRLAGNVGATLPLSALGPAAGAGTLPRLLAAGGAGALAGALNPVTEGDFATEKAKQAGVGAVAGGGSMLAGRVAAGTIMPNLRPAARLLVNEGVELTPGQMAGGMAKRAEDAMSSLPVLGSAMQAGMRRSIETFNRAAINRPLSEIGAALPRGLNAGRDAIEWAQQRISQAYDRLLPTLQWRADRQFLNDTGNLRTLVSEMPQAQRDQFEAILRNRVGQRIMGTGGMDGRTFKQVESELTAMIGPLRSSQDAAQKQLGSALGEVRDIMRSTLERSNPGSADTLASINRAYAGLSRVEDASMRRATPDGIFTPGDLTQAVKAAARRTGNRKSFAAGNAAMQDLAEAAQDVLPSTIPNSGTPERAMWAMLAGGGGASALLSNPAPAIAAGAAALPYTSPGMSLLRNYATAMPATRNYLAQALRHATPFAVPGVATAAPGALFAPQAPQP